VLAIPVQDIESQDHILAFQLPNAIRKYNVGLVVLDSVAANYRAEHGSAAPRDLATRAAQLAKLGKLLRDLAKEENIAVVVANQVSDRFEDLPVTLRSGGRQHSGGLKPPSLPTSSSAHDAPTSSAGYSEPAARESSLTLDFQQRFFTGWGDETSGSSVEGLKTPALGLAWTNQIACRIALKMETWRPSADTHDGTINTACPGGNPIWQERKKRRYLRLVFAPWAAATRDPVEYEIRLEGVAACKMDDDSTNQT